MGFIEKKPAVKAGFIGKAVIKVYLALIGKAPK